MNLTTTVMMILVLLLLCSGLFQFTFVSNHLRLFSTGSERSEWDPALNKCRGKGESLVTLYDDEDANFTQKYAEERPVWPGYFPPVWLGLTKNRTNVTTWSNGKPFNFSNSSVNVTNGTQTCEAMDNNTWKGFNCSDRHYFMCSKGNQYVLIEMEKDWCQAELYCREHYSNLVSISDEKQNQEVIKEGKNETFWIGLMHDEWEWVDKTCSTYRPWDPSQSGNVKGNCTIQMTTSTLMRTQECQQEQSVICSKGDTRIRVINQNATWEEALDYCEKKHTSLLWIKDGNDREAVNQWFENRDITGTFWIGLRQSIMFGFWIWKDSPVFESNWKNDRVPEMPFSHQCGVIDTAANNKWSDENCYHENPFICAEKILKF